jgi:uncharacterized membrane protein
MKLSELIASFGGGWGSVLLIIPASLIYTVALSET